MFNAMCRFRRVVLAALILLALSCASDEPLRFRFDSGTTAHEEELTSAAFARWAPYTVPDRTPVIDESGTWLITFTDDDTVLRPGLDGRTCGRERDPDNDCARDHWIRVRRRNDDYRTTNVIAHEAGHAMDLDHVGGRLEDGNSWGDLHSVMTEWIASATLSEADLTECRSANACGAIVARRIP